MSADNLNRIKTIANGLGELNERVVYVGGHFHQSWNSKIDDITYSMLDIFRILP